MSPKNLLVDSPAVDHCKVESPTDQEAMTHAEKLTAKFEAFKEETARMNRAYWASVRKAEQRSKEIQQSYTAVYQCPQCGLFRPADHSQSCTDLRPADLTNDQKLFRKDFAEDWNWDYDVSAYGE